MDMEFSNRLCSQMHGVTRCTSYPRLTSVACDTIALVRVWLYEATQQRLLRTREPFYLRMGSWRNIQRSFALNSRAMIASEVGQSRTFGRCEDSL